MAALASLAWWQSRPGEPAHPGERAPLAAGASTLLAAQAEEPGAAPDERAAAREALEASAASAPRAIDREHEISGIVLGPDAAPVAGALVVVLEIGAGGFLPPDTALRSRDRELARTSSDASGQFALRVPRGQPLDLSVSHAGFGRALLGYRLAGERVEVRLAPEARLEARAVRDSDGTHSSAAVRVAAMSSGASSSAISRLEPTRSSTFRAGMRAGPSSSCGWRAEYPRSPFGSWRPRAASSPDRSSTSWRGPCRAFR